MRIALIDMMNCFFRNFSALPLTNDNGEHVGGIFGCLQTFKKTIETFKPDMFYVAWEGKGSAQRRRKILKEYKEGRKYTGFNRIFETSEEDESLSMKRQLNILRELIKVLPLYQGFVDYLEADDLIAYICRKMFKEDQKIIISTDKDYWQLVDDQIIVYRPVKTKESKEGQIVTLSKNENLNNIEIKHLETMAIFNSIECHPYNFYLLKCFGEPTDNIEGIKGIGEKTVIKDFPFLNTLKDNLVSYNIADLIQYSETKVKEGVKKYSKYLEENNKDILLRNEKLIQLLEPDISLKSIQSIEETFTAYIPKFNIMEFRMILKRENISPKRIDDWISTFNRLKTQKIKF